MTDEIDRGRRSFLFGRKKRTPAKLPERAQPERARDAGTPFFARKGRPADGPPMVARIMSHACLVNAGQVCTVCSEHCPEEGAIVFWCGHGPVHLRLLPPLPVLKLEDWPGIFEVLERGLARAAG